MIAKFGMFIFLRACGDTLIEPDEMLRGPSGREESAPRAGRALTDADHGVRRVFSRDIP
jgi:hypothetical protein